MKRFTSVLLDEMEILRVLWYTYEVLHYRDILGVMNDILLSIFNNHEKYILVYHFSTYCNKYLFNLSDIYHAKQ